MPLTGSMMSSPPLGLTARPTNATQAFTADGDPNVTMGAFSAACSSSGATFFTPEVLYVFMRTTCVQCGVRMGVDRGEGGGER